MDGSNYSSHRRSISFDVPRAEEKRRGKSKSIGPLCSFSNSFALHGNCNSFQWIYNCNPLVARSARCCVYRLEVEYEIRLDCRSGDVCLFILQTLLLGWL